MNDSIVSGKCVKANLYMKVTSTSCDVILRVCTVIKRSCKKKGKKKDNFIIPLYPYLKLSQGI